MCGIRFVFVPLRAFVWLFVGGVSVAMFVLCVWWVVEAWNDSAGMRSTYVIEMSE